MLRAQERSGNKSRTRRSMQVDLRCQAARVLWVCRSAVTTGSAESALMMASTLAHHGTVPARRGRHLTADFACGGSHRLQQREEKTHEENSIRIRNCIAR